MTSFPPERHLRTPAEQERFCLDVARSDFATEPFDDIVVCGNLIALMRRGALVGEVNLVTIPKLGGTA